MRIRSYAGLAIVALLSGVFVAAGPVSASTNCYWQPVPGQPGNYTLEGDLSNCVISAPPSDNTPAPAPAPTATPTAMPVPTPTFAPAPVVTVAPAPAVTVAPVPVVTATPTATPTPNASALAQLLKDSVAKGQENKKALEEAISKLDKDYELLQEAIEKISPRTPVTVQLIANSDSIFENSAVRLTATISNAKATGFVKFSLEVTGRPELKKELCLAATLTAQATATCEFFTSANLTSSETYKVTAAYIGDADYSSAKVTSDFVISKAEQQKPCRPHVDLITPGDASATVLFTPSVFPGCGIANNYQVRESSTDKVLCETKTEKCLISGLTNGVTTEFYLVALNSSGSSDSDPATRVKQSVAALGKPAAPAIAVAQVLSANKIRVLWTGGETDGGSPLTSFVATSNDGTLECSNLLTAQVEKDANAYSCDINNPVAGKKYSFTVKAINKYGASLASPSTYEVATSASEVESFEHKITVSDGFVVLGITLSEIGNVKNQVNCVRASTCSIIVPKGGKWSYSIQDEFAHTLTDSATNFPVSNSSELVSDKDTKWIINTTQSFELLVSSRTVKSFPLEQKSKSKPNDAGIAYSLNKVIGISIEFGSYVVISPLFTPVIASSRSVEPGNSIPAGLTFKDGKYFGIPSKKETVLDTYQINNISYPFIFNITKFTYGAPNGVSIKANGSEISYTVKPNNSDVLEEVYNRPGKWEVQFFNSFTNAFIARKCSSSLSENVEIGAYAGVYVKAFAGCTDMKEPEYASYQISAASPASNIVATRMNITYSASSANEPVVTSSNSGEKLNLSFTVQPLTTFTLVPSSPLAVTDSEINNFALTMAGLKVDATGKISGSIKPDPASQISGQQWLKSVKVGGIEINFDVTLILQNVLPGTFSGMTVKQAAALPVGSTGSVNFNYKPAQTGTYKYTLEFVTRYSYYSDYDLVNDENDIYWNLQHNASIPLGTVTANYDSLNSAQVSLGITSGRIVLPGYLLDPGREGYLPYQLPVGGTYRIKVEAISLTGSAKTFYLDSSAISYSDNLNIVWPKPLAPKPVAPQVEATSKKGEVLVSGLVAAIWNYPALPVSVTVRACRVKNLGSCIIQSYSTLGSKGAVLMGGLTNEDFKFNVTFNIDPRNEDVATGPVSDWSKTVRPKK
jgi:hypothetical protein